MLFPKELKVFKESAEKALKEVPQGQIEFSGSTYQVQVFENEKLPDCWVFVQLDNQNRLKDYFCSCDETDDAPCVHLATAFLRIFNHTKEPLHKRFEKSLWHRLCYHYAKEHGFSTDLFKVKNKKDFVLGDEILISAKNKKTAAFLDHLIFHHPVETEDTSLKFSNLTEEELTAWKNNDPCPDLNYKLSFWSDLAKWLMIHQDLKDPYHISFDYDEQSLPNFIHISFHEMDCSFRLSKNTLLAIIPGLTSIQSPLKLFKGGADTIKSLKYDKKNHRIIVEHDKVDLKAEAPSFELGPWLYIVKKGFKALQNEEIISSSQMVHYLNEHQDLIEKYLDVPISYEEVPLLYDLKFDKKWNLHIQGYLFALNDLEEGNAYYFGSWVFLEKKGFFKLGKQHFDTSSLIINEEDVADFITKERLWLSSYPKFTPHLASLESQLFYSMKTMEGPLLFHREIEHDEVAKGREFDNWIYIPKKGFYPKITTTINLPVHLNTYIYGEHIPLFIRNYKPELALIKNFFLKDVPIEKAGLKVSYSADKKEIHIHPVYELKKGFEMKEISFFEEWAYIKNEGFAELNSEQKLPLAYSHPIVIVQKDILEFINSTLDGLKSRIVELDKELEPAKHIKLVAKKLDKIEDSLEYYYEADLYFETEFGEISLTEVLKLINKKSPYIFSKAGLLNLDLPRFDWLKKLDIKKLNKKNNFLKINILEILKINAYDEIEVIDLKSKEHLKDLFKFNIPIFPSLDGLLSELRPYQNQGLHWLWFLYCHQLSGLLCDDMGLGKTHQAMALFAAVKNLKKTNNPKFLIICPTSVIYHWQDKLDEFLPSLNLKTYHGTNRHIDVENEKFDILLTSYGIWRMDHKTLSKLNFEVAIFDEIQIAKNHNSRLHSTLSNVKSKMRLGLTGTPIENRLRELKSLFDLVLPGYMPLEKEFRERFIRPIEKLADPSQKGTLNRLIHPFILRRKKETVLLDLPEKIEEIAHCELSEEQIILYNQLIETSREAVASQMSLKNANLPYIHIFAILSGLKQICNHPACYLKDPANYEKYTSGKWDLFVELLEEARESNQKVVVFSQYLNMLDIIENHLKKEGVGFASIRGATINRRAELTRFNEDPNCKVFIGSLQAAGLGLDLTAGSVVIHYDRWWNAARENQATDRVHRIGQQRGVQVFKLVTKNSFEEKIDRMIQKKGRLMEEVVAADDHRLLKMFSAEELLELLQFYTPEAPE